MEGTSLPVGGKNTHSVITAHRGLPTARLFTDLNKLEVKDSFYLHILDRVLLYEIYEIEVIEPDQFEKLQIISDEDVVTLLTCTPYMINSHRLLVKGKRKPYQPEKEVQTVENVVTEETSCPCWIWIFIPLFIILFIVFILWKRKKDKNP